MKKHVPDQILSGTCNYIRIDLRSVLRLLHLVVSFVVVDHSFTKHLYGLEFLKRNCLTALCTDAAGHVV